jgi:nicotinamide-nucleotide amidase
MLASIITVGDEILIGQIVDTNSAWLGQKLNELGIKVHQIISISDDEAQILSTLENTLKESDFVFITGGLGPTKDDITKHTLCKFFDTKLVLHEDLLVKLKAYFEKRGRVINEANIGQAYLPENCTIIPNARGTAQAMWFEKDNKVVLSMPGVPHEMKNIMESEAIPLIKSKFELPEIIHKNIMTIGMGESIIAEKIVDIESNLPKNIKLAYLPNLGKVRLRLSAYTTKVEKINTINLVNNFSEQIVNRITENVYGFDEQKIEEVIGQLLLKNNETITTAESCTGGTIASILSSIPGCSAYYLGSYITYSYEMKMQELAVKQETLNKYGAVSEQCVEEMLDGLISRTKSTYGIAVSGIAGPSGGTEEKPVGTVYISVGDKNNKITKRYQFTNNREDNIIYSSNFALFMLYTFLKR